MTTKRELERLAREALGGKARLLDMFSTSRLDYACVVYRDDDRRTLGAYSTLGKNDARNTLAVCLRALAEKRGKR